MKNKHSALELLEQIIEKAEKEDEIQIKKAIEENKLHRTGGDSWMVFHLKVLRSLISSDDEWYTM